MIIQLFFNTEGYLGGWGIPSMWKQQKVLPLTTFLIEKAKANKNNTDPIAVEMSNTDFLIFHNSTIGRDHVEVLPQNSKSPDAEFGNLKLKFHEDQNMDLVDFAQAAHAQTYEKETHKLTEIEKDVKDLFKADDVSKAKKNKWLDEIDKRKEANK